MVNGGEDVKDGAEVGIGNVAVVFISIVAFPGRVPGAGRSLEFIDADRLGEPDLPVMDEFLHHGKDNVAGRESTYGHIMDGGDSPVEPGEDGEEEV